MILSKMVLTGYRLKMGLKGLFWSCWTFVLYAVSWIFFFTLLLTHTAHLTGRHFLTFRLLRLSQRAIFLGKTRQVKGKSTNK